MRQIASNTPIRICKRNASAANSEPALGQGLVLGQDRSILPQKRDLPWGRGLFWGRSGIYLSIEPHLDYRSPVEKEPAPGAEAFSGAESIHENVDR